MMAGVRLNKAINIVSKLRQKPDIVYLSSFIYAVVIALFSLDSLFAMRPEPLSAHHYIDLKNLQALDSGKALITRNEAARSAQTECACGLQCIGSFQMRGSAYVCSVRDDCGA